MIYNKQNNENFLSHIEDLKKEYSNQEKAYNWKFNYNLEQFGEVKYFIITNKFSTTKLAFDEQLKIIVRTLISDVDINRILKLKEGL